MSALSIQPTYPIFTETDGQPLEDGYIWIGAANLDPQGNPISVFFDAALTIPASQPIRTLGGYPSNSGTPARLYVNSDYSIRVMNKNGSVVYSAPAATERYGNIINATDVTYDPPFTGGAATTVAEKLAQYVSVKDFGAVGDGVTDDSVAIQAALTASDFVYFPEGTYASSAELTLQRDQYLLGDGREKSIIKFTGATRGIVFDSPSKVDATLTFESLMIQGNSSALSLVYLVNTGSINFDNCIVRNTSEECVYLGGEVISFSFRNSYLEAFENYGINCAGSLAGLMYLENVKANGFTSLGTTPSTDSSVIFLGGPLLSQVKMFQVNVNGGANLNVGAAGIGSLIRSDSGEIFQLTTEQCYTEYIKLPAVYATGTAKLTMFVANQCNYSTGNSVSIDLNNGQSHEYVSVVQCRRPSSGGYIFDPGSTTDWAFLQGSRESGVQFIVGYVGLNNIVNYGSAGVRHLTELTVIGELNALGGVDLDNSCKISQTSGDIVINAPAVGKSITQRVSGSDQVVVATDVLRPAADNTKSCGNGSFRWSVVYAGTGTINTSDEREKQDIAELEAAEKRVAVSLKGLLKKFKFKDAVNIKGDAARIHVGVIAQDVIAAFAAEGLDATRYGLLCHDYFDAADAQLDDDGNVTVHPRDAGDRYGVRYEELFAFIIASL